MKITRILTIAAVLSMISTVSLAQDLQQLASSAKGIDTLMSTPQTLEELLMLGYGVDAMPRPVMRNELLAKAPIDECYNGVGNPYPPLNLDGSCTQGVSKRNQAYAWALAQSGNKLWLGTYSNTICNAMIAFPGDLGSVLPLETSTFVCEGSAAASGTGDVRSPKIYRYNLGTKALTDMTPTDLTVDGFRGAGALGNIVFFGGLKAGFLGGGDVTLYAFDSLTETFLGSQPFPEYSNIRKWIVVNGVLYTALEKKAGGGVVLRWRGSPTDLWNFEVVGTMKSGGANMTLYNGNRIAISTWPSLEGASVYLSPEIPADGLSAADAANWIKVFAFRNYEPDPVVAATYAGGDIAYFDGWLYWGSMHLPGISYMIHKGTFGSDAAPDQEALLKTWRATSVWRGRNLETASPEIQLLYGESELNAYDYNPYTHTGTKTFISRPTGWTPVYGSSGFGNPLNSYVWTMGVADNRLFMGTLDISYIIGSLLSGQVPDVVSQLGQLALGYGADIWRFDSSHEPAVLESRDGAGNYVNYGIRTMLTAPDGNKLYIGTANPFNIDPLGGWDLIEMHPGGAWAIKWLEREFWFKLLGWDAGNRTH